MSTYTNGHTPATHTTAPLTVRDEPDRGGALLDELDDVIAVLDAALADQCAARVVIADAETELAIIEASHMLAVTGGNEASRKAALTLALRDDAAYQQLARTVRDARAAYHEAERRCVVAKERCRLLRAALALVADG